MSLQHGRYTAMRPLSLVEGRSSERLTPPSRLCGANGLRTGPDGRIDVAQVTGPRTSRRDAEAPARTAPVLRPSRPPVCGHRAWAGWQALSCGRP